MTNGLPARGSPLDGIRVLDFSRVLAGPHCGRMLSDLGADVIKIEPPAGDLSRFAPPHVNSIAISFTQLNCGKRNISLDLAHPEGRDLLRRLACDADVVLENFRAGVMNRLGLGWEDLSARNPRLVFASITGYGQSGPWSDRRAYAPLIAAEVGFLDLFAFHRETDVAQDVYSHADLYSALECLAGIMAALLQRQRTGRGQHVEVAMADVLLSVSEFAGSIWSGHPPSRDYPPGTVASPVFDTAEGHKITIAGDPAPRENFHLWCRAMGREDLRDDPRFADLPARVANKGELLRIIGEWVYSIENLDELGGRLEEAGHSYGIVRTLNEIAESEWARARGTVAEVDDRGGGVVKIPNSPWRFSDAESGVHGVPAYRGEHNRAVFSELLGLTGGELDDLEERGVLSSRGPRR